MQTRTLMLALTMALFSALTACGGGLSYTIDEADVKGLTGEPGERVLAARGDVAAARAVVEDSKKEHQESEKRVDTMEKSVDKAGAAIDQAKSKVDKAESGLDDALSKAKDKRDKAIDAAKATYDKEVEALKIKYGDEIKAGSAEAALAKKDLDIKEAQQEFEEALLDERAARKEVAEAKLNVAKAKYELTKFDALAEAKGRSGAAVTAERLDFQEQVSDAERTLLGRERKLNEREAATAKKRAAFERLAPPAPKPEGGEPKGAAAPAS